MSIYSNYYVSFEPVGKLVCILSSTGLVINISKDLVVTILINLRHFPIKILEAMG